jgi:UDP-N-acetylglucosamine/UDP-N-acetyl-alpha-D-glucosaminouronate 4-epimerase
MPSPKTRRPKNRVHSVLVTGGAGFIGSHIVRRLLRDGYEVRVLDSFATGKRANIAGLDRLDVVEADVRSPAALRAAMADVDAVFHLAALPSVARSWSDPVATLATNAHGTANVAESAHEAGVSCLVYSSSSSIYGEQEVELKAESLEPHPISPYAYSKLLGEKIALAHARDRSGMRVVALRYFNVFGARQDPDSPYSAVIPLFMKAALSGSPATIFGDGLQSRDFTHVDNVVDANVRSLESTVSGVALNIATGESHTLLELSDAISRLGGRPLQIAHKPPRQGDIRHSRADLSLAAVTIGYRPSVGFEDGLRRTFEEFRSS